MMHKRNIVVAIAIGATLLVGGLVWSKERGQDKQEESRQMVALAAVAIVSTNSVAFRLWPRLYSAGIASAAQRTCAGT